VVLYLVTDGLLVWPCAAAEQGPDAEGVVLGGDDLLAPHPVHASQVLLVHDVLLDGLAGARLVGGLQPGEAEHAVRLVVAHPELHLLGAGGAGGPGGRCRGGATGGARDHGAGGALGQGRPGQDGWAHLGLHHGRLLDDHGLAGVPGDGHRGVLLHRRRGRRGPVRRRPRHCLHHPHQDACLGPVALGLHGDKGHQQLHGAVRLHQGVAGDLPEAGEGVEALEHRDQQVDVVQAEVLRQLAVHRLLQQPLDEVLIDLLPAELVEDVQAGDDLEPVLGPDAPGEGAQQQLRHRVLRGLL